MWSTDTETAKSYLYFSRLPGKHLLSGARPATVAHMIWPRKYGVPRSRLRRSATLQLHTPTGSKRGTPASRSSTSTVSTNSCNTYPHPNPDPNPDPNPNALTLTLSLTLTVQKVLAGEIAKLPRPPAAAVTAHARTRARASRTRGRRPAAARPSRTFGSRRARQPGRTGGHGPTSPFWYMCACGVLWYSSVL